MLIRCISNRVILSTPCMKLRIGNEKSALVLPTSESPVVGNVLIAVLCARHPVRNPPLGQTRLDNAIENLGHPDAPRATMDCRPRKTRESHENLRLERAPNQNPRPCHRLFLERKSLHARIQGYAAHNAQSDLHMARNQWGQSIYPLVTALAFQGYESWAMHLESCQNADWAHSDS